MADQNQTNEKSNDRACDRCGALGQALKRSRMRNRRRECQELGSFTRHYCVDRAACIKRCKLSNNIE